MIAFRSERTGDSEIWSVNFDGSFPVNLTEAAGVDWFPDWGR
jgi:Tol biopolymer transport system component